MAFFHRRLFDIYIYQALNSTYYNWKIVLKQLLELFQLTHRIPEKTIVKIVYALNNPTIT